MDQRTQDSLKYTHTDTHARTLIRTHTVPALPQKVLLCNLIRAQKWVREGEAGGLSGGTRCEQARRQEAA